ncbi:hypothetical protein PkP19E3_25135 [Pseudomonas koreensis]|nr:hypothetical protein PkP19E3_25135 [Pseudomonas koreensis]
MPPLPSSVLIQPVFVDDCGRFGKVSTALRTVAWRQHHPCRSCRRLRSFDLEKQHQKIAACGSSYRGSWDQ